MAPPLTKEVRAKIVEYLEQLDLSELTGIQIKKLVEENLGIKISQPTVSKLKGEILSNVLDDESESPLNDEIVETTKPDKTRQLSIEQENAVEHLLQGKSDRAVAEAVGVSRQTVWEWRNNDPLFIAELNRQRSEMWREARERLKSLTNRALDVVEVQLDSSDPKVSLVAAKYILQGTRLLGDTDLPIKGPMTPKAVILERLRFEARQELIEEDKKNQLRNPMLELDPFKEMNEINFANRVEDLAQSRLKEALSEAGLS
jgi:hypothetical protein